MVIITVSVISEKWRYGVLGLLYNYFLVFWVFNGVG